MRTIVAAIARRTPSSVNPSSRSSRKIRTNAAPRAVAIGMRERFESVASTWGRTIDDRQKVPPAATTRGAIENSARTIGLAKASPDRLSAIQPTPASPTSARPIAIIRFATGRVRRLAPSSATTAAAPAAVRKLSG